MANINLRVGNDALTFAEVDSNFTNLNSESFYGGITFTSGVLKFQPIGSDGTGGSDPYPPIEINLDASYINQVSSTDFADLNSIAEMPDDRNTELTDSSIDTSGFVSPTDKLLISDKGGLLYNAPSFGHQGSTFDAGDVELGSSPGLFENTGNTGNWLAHPSSVPQQFLADYLDYDTSSGTIEISATNPNGIVLNRYDDVAGHIQLFSAGTAAFLAQMNHMKSAVGATLFLYSGTGYHRRKITGVTYTQNAAGENTGVTITTTVAGQYLGSPGSTITGIKIQHDDNLLKQLSTPRAPLTPPITPPIKLLNTQPYSQVLSPAARSYRVDQADLALAYADNTRLICQGLVSKGNMLISPVERSSGTSSNPINGSQVHEMMLDDGIGGKSLSLFGGDTIRSTLDSVSQQGGNLTLGAGVNTNISGSGTTIDYISDATLSMRDEPEDYQSLSEFSDSARPLIKLFGRQGYDTAKQNSVVISAGRNYAKTTYGVNSAHRVGGDIRFLLGTGSGQGVPGDFVIEGLEVPTADTGEISAAGKPNNSADVNPFKIEWDSDNYEYKTKIPNIDGTIKVELAELYSAATTANHAFDTNGDGIVSSADTNAFRDFTHGNDVSGVNIEEGTIIKGVTKTTYDTGGSNQTYEKIYEFSSGVESITPRLMMFSGSSSDLLRNGVQMSRFGGDLIVLGNIEEKTNGDVSFHNGLLIDGNSFDLKNSGGYGISLDGLSAIIEITAGETVISASSGGVSINNDLSVTGEINASGDITAFSDESIKENVEVIEDAVDKVQQLNGYTFDRTDVETSRQTGVIAQEVLKVLPEAVGEKDGIHTVAYGNMVGLLIEAIKEQQGQIDSLKEELQSIKSINK
jgi:hypothetical protein